MAKSGVDTEKLMFYGVLGVGIYVAYKMSAQGKLGPTAKQAATDVRGALVGAEQPPVVAKAGAGSSTPSGSTQSSGVVSIPGVFDIGDVNNPLPTFPIVYDPSLGTVRQDPRKGGTNIYRIGDVFFVNGQLSTYVGGKSFTAI